MRPLYEDIFRKQGKWLRVFIGKSTVEDPYEKNTTVTNVTSVPIKAIVEDLTTTQAHWSMPGVKTSKVKDILIEAKHLKLIEQSSQIEYAGEFYTGWKEHGKMQVREEPGVDGIGYLRIYIYTKVV